MNAQRWAIRLLHWLAPLAVLLLALAIYTPVAAQDSLAATQDFPIWIGAPVQITGGLYHTCARSVEGSILCWGGNGLSLIHI